jgi:predicted lactoylglutathione lyase
MSMTGLVHLNVNCSDFQRSLQFYQMLGFEKSMHVPEQNSRGVKTRERQEN